MEKVQICRQKLNNPISRGSKLTALVGLILFTASLACSTVSVSLNSNPSATPGLVSQAKTLKPEVKAASPSANMSVTPQSAQLGASSQGKGNLASPTALPPPTLAPPTLTPDPDAKIRNAKVLLYEDAATIFSQRYAKDGLNALGISYTDVSGVIGTFKQELIGGTPWDLVIMASESRSYIQGEYFTYLSDLIDKKTAMIIELWYLDKIANTTIHPILSRCGVAFQKNWFNPDRDSRSIFWFDPSLSLFQHPNKGMSLEHYGPYWEGDVGDMMMAVPGKNSKLLGGLYEFKPEAWAMLAECEEGRVILQTFSSHDYRPVDMGPLWQNYIYYTLKNHFQAVFQGG